MATPHSPPSVESTSDESCPECNGQLASENGEIVCKNCALVITSSTIDHGPEWREFSSEDRSRARCGPPRTIRRHDRGLGSTIGWTDSISAKKRKQISRFRREERNKTSKYERNRIQILSEVQRIINQAGGGESLKDRACQLAHDAHEADLAPGESLESVALAVVIAAIREAGIPIPMAELRSHTDVGRRRAYRTLQKVYDTTDITRQIIEPIDHLPRICSQLSVVDNETKRLAEDITLSAQASELHIGRNPATIAAGAVYTAGQLTGQQPTQAAIGDAAGLTKTTVRAGSKAISDAEILETVTTA